MYKKFITGIIVFCATASPLWGHAPYLETDDYSFAEPFRIKHSIEKSIAVYAWLDNETDVDVYTFTLKRPQRLYVKVIVPVCAVYEDFYPWFAVVGPGIRENEASVPFEVPTGMGIEVVTQIETEPSQRETFYEPFGMKSYYDGSTFDRGIEGQGTWYIVVWNSNGISGDYVTVVGFKERFSPVDILRSFYLVPRIWLDKELHNACD